MSCLLCYSKCKRRNYENRQADRNFIRSLTKNEKVTAPELASRFEVSRRTINRDIEDLCMAGIPVVTEQGRDGGISILENFPPGPDRFDPRGDAGHSGGVAESGQCQRYESLRSVDGKAIHRIL